MKPIIGAFLIAGLAPMVSSRPAAAPCSFTDNPAESGASTRAAISADGVIRVLAPPETMMGNLIRMTRAADVIAVGTVADCKTLARETSEGTLLGTRYELTVTRALKGQSLRTGRISVDYPGGRRESASGIVVETRVPAFRPPEIGDQLVVFVKRGPSQEALDLGSEYVPFPSFLNGLMSSFRLPPDGTVQPAYHGNPSAVNVVTQVRGMKASDFVAQILEILKS